MGFKKNNPGCNCCGGCSIASDDFGRADDTDINAGSSCGWTEDSGSWDISSGKLRCTTAGVVTCSTTHPDSATTMEVQATVDHNTNGSSCDVIVCKVDGSNWFYARFTFGGAGAASIAIRKNVAGTHSTIKTVTGLTFSASSAPVARVCVDDLGSISAYLNGVVKITAFTQAVTGTGAGFSCNGSGTALFNDFVFSKTAADPDATGCDICTTGPCVANLDCCGSIPTQFDVSLPATWVDSSCGSPNSCATFGGTYTLSRISPDPGGFPTWYLETTAANCPTRSCLTLTFTCGGSDCTMRVFYATGYNPVSTPCSGGGAVTPLYIWWKVDFSTGADCANDLFTLSYDTSSVAGGICVPPGGAPFPDITVQGH